MLKLSNVGLKRDKWVLREIQLEIKEGAIYGVIGKSGAGKTSLLKIMAGLLDTTEGFVEFNSVKLIGPVEKLIPGYDDIQLVNQDFELSLFQTVEENVREKILSRHLNHQQEIIDEVLQLVELDSLKTKKAHSISGGEQQRLALARAIACEPKILLLDEPFVHIDQRLRWKIMKFLMKLNEEMNTTIILVSHDGAEMMGFADDIIHLNDSKIQRNAPAKEVYYHPNSKEEAELMGPINEIKVGQENVLFRPNEYAVERDSKLAVEFCFSIDTGLNCFNYFDLNSGEKIMLVDHEEMKDVSHITIYKKA